MTQTTHKSTGWKWFGNAGHFICSQWCRFHLCTVVNGYIVSTVGEYVHPMRSQGNEKIEGEWLMKHPFGEEIGCGRLFETMVFPVGQPCESVECGCGLPTIGGDEVAFEGYNTRKEANAGHMKMCRRFARRVKL
jgi:hypothetical protein